MSRSIEAKQLWPLLEAEILDESSPEAPTIAKVVYEAYLEAQKFRYWTYVLRAAPRSSGEQAEVPWQLGSLSQRRDRA
jgi:hypothetical protein